MNSSHYSIAIKFMIVLRQKKKIILLRKAKQLDETCRRALFLNALQRYQISPCFLPFI
jgi:hypothetical protein